MRGRSSPYRRDRRASPGEPIDAEARGVSRAALIRSGAMTRLTVCVLASLLAACACKNKTDTGPGGNGDGTGGAKCEEIKVHVEKLYRAEATGDDIDEQVADN